MVLFIFILSSTGGYLWERFKDTQEFSDSAITTSSWENGKTTERKQSKSCSLPQETGKKLIVNKGGDIYLLYKALSSLSTHHGIEKMYLCIYNK